MLNCQYLSRQIKIGHDRPFFPHIISLAPKAVSKAADTLQFAGEAARGYKPIVLQDRAGIGELGKGSERDRWFWSP